MILSRVNVFLRYIKIKFKFFHGSNKVYLNLFCVLAFGWVDPQECSNGACPAVGLECLAARRAANLKITCFTSAATISSKIITKHSSMTPRTKAFSEFWDFFFYHSSKIAVSIVPFMASGMNCFSDCNLKYFFI
jgi:hypothetical protein